ncbi:MAG: hypothetical protein ABSF50_11745 [Burkholderiaceae bacterium]|jgi:hypothetical protein
MRGVTDLKFVADGATTLDELADLLEAQAREFRQMAAAQVNLHGPVEGGVIEVSAPKKVAARFENYF